MTKIIADTLSGIPVEEAKALGLTYIPQIINFKGKSYRDDSEMNTKMFLDMLIKSEELPTTAAPPPDLYSKYYQEFSKNNETIIVICPSTELSGTFRSATVAAKDFSNSDIRIINTMQLGGGLASTIKSSIKLLNEGKSANEIEKFINEFIHKENNYFVVDTLEYLHKGGRIGGAQALFGGILQIKPILCIKQGKVEPVESQRTSKRAISRLKEIVLTDCPRNQSANLSIMHGDAEKKANEIAEYFSNTLGINDIPIYELPPAFLVHSGPGVIGASFFQN